MKPTIGFDLDGVICDIYPDAFKVLKEMYPSKILGEWSGNVGFDSFGLSEEQIMNCFIECGRRGIFRKARIYPGTKEILYKLVRRYNIYFITWRNYIPNAREDNLYWLDSNKIPYERLIMTNNKYKIALKENLCLFLDDNVQQCNRIAKTIVPTYLFRRPWNEKHTTDALVKRVSSLREIELILNF